MLTAGSHSLSSSSNCQVQGRFRHQQELLTGSDIQGTLGSPLHVVFSGQAAW